MFVNSTAPGLPKIQKAMNKNLLFYNIIWSTIYWILVTIVFANGDAVLDVLETGNSFMDNKIWLKTGLGANRIWFNGVYSVLTISGMSSIVLIYYQFYRKRFATASEV